MTACALGGDAGAGRKIAASNHIAVPTPSFSESAGMLEKIKNLLGAKNTHLAAQLALLGSPEAASAGVNPAMQQWLGQQIQERKKPVWWALATTVPAERSSEDCIPKQSLGTRATRPIRPIFLA